MNPEPFDYFVYCLCFDRSVRYFGITRENPSKRLVGHMADARRGKPTMVCDWIRRLISENKSPVIITLRSHATQLEASELERKLISFFKKSFCLLNKSYGGQLGAPRRNPRRDRILRKMSNMRAAKERKRRERAAAGLLEREPKMVRWHRFQYGVKDKQTGEIHWRDLVSVRQAAKALSLIIKFV